MSAWRWVPVAAALIATGGVAQGEELPSVVTGVVTDARTGLPIAGATVVTGEDVIVGDDAGRFEIAGTTRFVVVQAPGYSERTLALTGATAAALAVVLEPKDIADEVIELVGVAPELGDGRRTGSTPTSCARCRARWATRCARCRRCPRWRGCHSRWAGWRCVA